jgi:hypothetical protein
MSKHFEFVTRGYPSLQLVLPMAVTFTHAFLWGSSATNHIEKALMAGESRLHMDIFLIFLL